MIDNEEDIWEDVDMSEPEIVKDEDIEEVKEIKQPRRKPRITKEQYEKS